MPLFFHGTRLGCRKCKNSPQKKKGVGEIPHKKNSLLHCIFQSIFVLWTCKVGDCYGPQWNWEVSVRHGNGALEAIRYLSANGARHGEGVAKAETIVATT